MDALLDQLAEVVHKIKHMVDVEPIWVAADAPPLDITKRVRHTSSPPARRHPA